MPEDYYELLGIDRDASEEAILGAYREQAAEHHPDVSDAPDAPERFRRLNRAKRVLTDDGRRRRYDRLGHERFLERTDDDELNRAADGGGMRDVAGFEEPLSPAFERLFGTWLGSPSRGSQEFLEWDPVDLTGSVERRAWRPWPTGGNAPCPTCHGRGTIVHDYDTGRGRYRRLESCDRCRGDGTR